MFGSFFGIADYGTFVISILVFMLIPGPGNLALITSTSKGGIRGGLAATFGIIAGDQILLWLAVAGVAALLATYPAAFKVVQFAGAAYLTFLGIKMLLVKAGDAPILKMATRHFFMQSVAITLLNPKAIVFYMAFFPLFINPAQHQGLLTFSVMAGSIATIGFLYSLVVILITHFAAERIRSSPRMTSALNKIAGLFLIGFGIKLAVSK
jgi:leucine efflux protein